MFSIEEHIHSIAGTCPVGYKLDFLQNEEFRKRIDSYNSQNSNGSKGDEDKKREANEFLFTDYSANKLQEFEVIKTNH